MSRLKNRSRRVWTDAKKEQLIRDVGDAPVLKHACSKHGVSDSWFRKMKREYLAEHPDFKMKPRHRTGWPTDPVERRREAERRRSLRRDAQVAPPDGAAVKTAVTGYKLLSNIEKRAFREAHNLSPAQMSMILRGVATPVIQHRILSNGNQGVRDMRLTRIPDEIPVIDLIPDISPPVVSEPATLAFAIQAFEIKLDHMREFTDQLKRMLRGGR